MARRIWIVGITVAGLWLGGYVPSLAREMLLAQTSPSTQTLDPPERATAISQRVIKIYQTERYQQATLLAEEVLII